LNICPNWKAERSRPTPILAPVRWQYCSTVNQIRPPRRNELALLRRIERDASQRFAETGLRVIAAHEPPSIAELERSIGVGQAWVAVTDRDRPVGYLLAATVDDCAHVVQVSVARAHASRRLGAALIDHLATIAGQAGQPALTLTTFRDVAWNAPYSGGWGSRSSRRTFRAQDSRSWLPTKQPPSPATHRGSQCADGSLEDGTIRIDQRTLRASTQASGSGRDRVAQRKVICDGSRPLDRGGSAS
jgi:hypothetical protein